MSGMKTAEEKAEAYATHAKDCTCKGTTMNEDKRVGFLAGHAEGLREAGELVQSLKDWIARPSLSKYPVTKRDMRDALTKFKARLGQTTAGDE